MRRLAAIGVLVGLGLLVPPPAVRAAAPEQQGWWHGATPLDVVLDALQIPGLDLPLGEVSAVDVPADGLLVQGGTAGPAAYAAIAFAVGAAPLEGPLRLEPSPLAVTVPGSQLTACPLDAPSFTPVQGGRRQAAPRYDCLGAVTATAEPDGTFLIDVATLRRGDRVAIAILPASPSTRVVLQAPGDDALPLGAAPEGSDGSSDGTAAGPAPPVGGGGAAFDPIARDVGPAPGPASPVAPAGAIGVNTGAEEGGGLGRTLVFGGIAAGAAVLWFAAGQLGLGRPRAGRSGRAMTAALASSRRAWIEAELGVTVADARPIGQGASRATWLVELTEGEPVVLREETGRGPMAGTPLDLAREAVVYRALAPVGLPIPALLAEAEDAGAILLTHAPGDAALKGLGPDAVGAISADLGRCLARLHLVDPEQLALGAIAADDDLELWAGIAATRAPAPATPVAGVALRWLSEHGPADDGPRSLCHGDAGAGNFLHDGGAVTALLDWEFAHVDDPHDDLAWVAVRNQVQRRPLDVGAVFGAWQDTTGRAIDPARLEHHRALVLTRMLVSCDAALAWAGEAQPPVVQSMLRPYLGLALVEALRRTAAGVDRLDDMAEDARARWAPSPIAEVLDDPTDLDDLGGPW